MKNVSVMTKLPPPPIYVTEHLPKKLQEQRKLLLPYYKEAKLKKQKTFWKALDGNYVLFVNGEKVETPHLKSLNVTTKSIDTIDNEVVHCCVF